MPLLGIDIEARFAQVLDALGQIDRKTQSSARSMSSAFNGVKSVLGALGVGISIAGLVQFTRATFESVAALDDLAEKSALTVETISKLQEVTRIGGTSIESAADIAGKFAKAISAAAGGNKEFIRDLAQIGITAADLKNKGFDELFVQFATRIADAPDKVNALALAAKLAGRGAQEALPFFNDLADRGLGAAKVSAEQAKQAELLQKQFRELTRAAAELQQELAVKMIPTLLNVGKAMADAAKEGKGLFGIISAGLGGARQNDDVNMMNREIVKQTDYLLGLQKVLERDPTGERGNPGLVRTIEQTKAYIKSLQTLVKITENPVTEPAATKPAGKPVGAVISAGAGGAGAVKDLDAAYRALAGPLEEKLALDKKSTELDRLMFTLSEMRADQYAKLTSGQIGYVISLANSVDAKNRDKAATEAYLAVLKEMTAEQEASDQFLRDRKKAEDDAVMSVQKNIEQIQFETSIMGLSNRERELAIALHDIETAGLDRNSLAYQQMSENMKKALDAKALAEKNKEAAGEITEFWKSAAQSMQQSMSTLFFDIMQGNLTDLASSFKRTIDQMVANVLAAKAATALFGADFGKGGDIGGLVGKGIGMFSGGGSGIAGLFSKGGLGGGIGPLATAAQTSAYWNVIGAFADGSPFVPRTGMALIHRGERIIPAKDNARGGAGISVNMTVVANDANSFRASRGQIMAELSLGLAGARRNL